MRKLLPVINNEIKKYQEIMDSCFDSIKKALFVENLFSKAPVTATERRLEDGI